MINIKREKQINDLPYKQGIVAYWMDRDRRSEDNWALLHAQNKALELKKSLLVFYVIPKTFLDSSLRQYHFMIEGLKETQEKLIKKNIELLIVFGEPEEKIPKLIKKYNVGFLYRDFSPLKIVKKWNAEIVKKLTVPFVEIDTRNIVPVWEASNKQEYAARTIRPKIHAKLEEFLTEIPKVKKHPHTLTEKIKKTDFKKIYNQIEVNTQIKPVSWIQPGEKAAKKMLEDFISEKLSNYAELRNDPSKDYLSHLSPYLHFGHISAGRVALEIQKNAPNNKNSESFLEELIVRRELSDNFCYYNKNYDSLKGAPDWAQITLNDHRDDSREYIYPKKEFEQAKTHDDAWNAAQIELQETGKMHGYMRMYWAKKILEWTKTPEDALKIAIYLNDAYSLDGRDPNGYVGIMWSIAGVHDRGWTEREIFGKVRYMNFNGLKRKFDIQAYIHKFIPEKQKKLL